MCRCVCVWCVCVCVCVYSSRAIDRMDAYVSIHMITHTRTNTHAHTHTHTHTHTHSHTLTHTHTHTHTHGVDKHLQRVFPPPPPLSLSLFLTRRTLSHTLYPPLTLPFPSHSLMAFLPLSLWHTDGIKRNGKERGGYRWITRSRAPPSTTRSTTGFITTHQPHISAILRRSL